MKLPAYPRTKPSGIEWLGDVPEHWEVKRLKTSASCWVSNVDKVPAEDELPVRLCNYTDVYYHDHITPDMELMETTATADEIRRFGLRVGDVVITKDSEEWSDIAVPALVKKSTPDLVCGYHLAIIRSHPESLFGDYLLRAFQSCAVNQQFQVAASGVTRYGIPKASIGHAWIPLPDLPEQQAIAAFLDRETGRVDRLVAKKRELIERLKEKRTALISRTVTRGLPAEAAAKAGLPVNPPLKPSGLDWLGNIPEHWDAKPLKFIALVKTGFAFSSDDFTDEGVPVLRIGDINRDGQIDFTNAKCLPDDFLRTNRDVIVRSGDIAMAMTGATIGKVGRYRHQMPALLNQRVCIFRPMHGASIDYLWYLLNTDFYMEHVLLTAFGGAQPNISDTQLLACSVPVPPLTEQAAIAAYLDLETAKLDALVGKVEEAVERLQEYRTALITAAVTGKIDVRKAALDGRA